MSAPRIGSLCSGYGGLDMAVEAVIPDAELAWVSDIDKGACKVLAHRYPDVLNLGDFTKTDWATVEPIDILTAGYPCQPFSHAGNRKGANDERHLWPAVREAIRGLRPRVTLLENVAGHRSLGFDRVLGDLAEDGLHVQWTSVRASDVGACHRRERLFILVADSDRAGFGGLGRQHAERRDADGRDRADRPRQGDEPAALLPTPVADNSRGLPSSTTDYASLANAVCALLPTPAVNDMGEGKTVEAWDEWTAKMQAAHGNGNGHGKSLAIEAQRLLPTPTSANAADGADLDDWEAARLALVEKGYNGNGRGTPLAIAVRLDNQWGDYADAIARWEALTRPAPAPTQLSKKGTPQLSAAFSEWMMGLPTGWITDVPGITRNEALKLAGNGVVWQQAAAALRIMLARAEDVAA